MSPSSTVNGIRVDDQVAEILLECTSVGLAKRLFRSTRAESSNHDSEQREGFLSLQTNRKLMDEIC